MAARGFTQNCTRRACIVREIRVARLMRDQGLLAQRPRHRTVTTHSEPGAPVAPNLLPRDESRRSAQHEMGRRHNLHLDSRGVVVPGGSA
jgi:transposase InsO family protein